MMLAHFKAVKPGIKCSIVIRLAFELHFFPGCRP